MQVPIRVVQAAGRAHPMRCEAAPEPTCRANTPFRNIQHETHREQASLAPIVKRGGTSQAEEEGLSEAAPELQRPAAPLARCSPWSNGSAPLVADRRGARSLMAHGARLDYEHDYELGSS